MRNHDLVSLGDNFINSYRQDLNFAFPSRVQEPKTVACSSKWAEGQVKTPHMHKQSCTSRFGAWSGSTPPLFLMNSLTLQVMTRRKGLNSHSFWRRKCWLICLPFYPILSCEGSEYCLATKC